MASRNKNDFESKGRDEAFEFVRTVFAEFGGPDDGLPVALCETKKELRLWHNAAVAYQWYAAGVNHECSRRAAFEAVRREIIKDLASDRPLIDPQFSGESILDLCQQFRFANIVEDEMAEVRYRTRARSATASST
jgi:hypothetical protein